MPRGRPSKAKAEEKPAEEKEALADVDENAKVAPKRGRGRPPKENSSSTGSENVGRIEVGEEPAVKKAKKKSQKTKTVSKISIEFCKS